MESSRTYKLMLSDKGIDLFLDCHCRLSHLVRDLIPYGMTLTVAVKLLEGLDTCEIVAEAETRRLTQSYGTQPHFVGSSTKLTEVIARIKKKINNSNEIGVIPSIGKLYVLALFSLEAAEDGQIMAIYQRLIG